MNEFSEIFSAFMWSKKGIHSEKTNFVIIVQSERPKQNFFTGSHTPYTKLKKNPLFYLTFPYISRPLSISTNFCYCHIYQYLHMSFTKFEQNIFIGFRKIQIKWSAVGAIFKHKIIGKFHNIHISSFFKTVLFSSKDRYSHQTTCAVFFQPCCSYTIDRTKSILFHIVYIILFQEAQKGF